MPAPRLLHISVRGLNFAVWEWPGDDPPVLLVHATGFHGRIWDQSIRQLTGRHAFAIELRGHGRSSKPEPPYHWKEFGLDVSSIADVLKIDDAIGVGHSTGAHALVRAVAERPSTCAALMLIDPTIFPHEFYGAYAGDSSFIARRRNVWQSPEEMFERFRDRVPFSTWQPDVLHDYCEFGVLPRDGEYVLACHPDIEADIYKHANEPESDIYDLVSGVRQPVTVMRGGIPWIPGIFNLDASPTAPDLASRFPTGRDLLLEGRTHYIPMESPEMVAEEIRRTLTPHA